MLQPGPRFTLGSFFLAFIFLELRAASSPIRNPGREEEKVSIRLYTLVEGTEKVKESPRFWDRSGNLCFSRPLSFRSLYGWLFLSACPQPLTKRTGCGLCQASPGRVQEAESWGSEGSWPLGLRGPGSLLDLTSRGLAVLVLFSQGWRGQPTGAGGPVQRTAAYDANESARRPQDSGLFSC